MKDDRWPGWVYAEGHEPDYRFSLANERTFLAWIRTSLALLAGGVALDNVDVALPDAAQKVIAAGLVTLGLLSAALSWTRWARSERAMRRSLPLPGLSFAMVCAVAIGCAAVVLLVAGI